MHYELGYVMVSRQLSMTWVCRSETTMFRKWTRKSNSYVLNTKYTSTFDGYHRSIGYQCHSIYLSVVLVIWMIHLGIIKKIKLDFN